MNKVTMTCFMYTSIIHLFVVLDCFPLFLLKCPQHPDWMGHYILCYNDNDISVYSTQTNRLEWSWSVNQLRRYCYEPKIPFVEIEAGRYKI